MNSISNNPSHRILGVNGLGRIGKLTVWNQVARSYFHEIVVNVGREVGTSFFDLVDYIERDSTYGSLGWYLHGARADEPVVVDVDETKGALTLNGVRVTILRTTRNPSEIPWRDHGVKLVVDTTGQFLDPTLPSDAKKGALRGHIYAGALKVIVSAPFKIKDKGIKMPEDAVTTVMGVNGNAYDPTRHTLISNASCTTSCLAHMLKPLIDHFGVKKILSASMATVHAATGSQQVLDRLPGNGATDLRKNRSILNNIILTTTGAAKTLQLVIPEMAKIGFIAESVRIPTSTGSLIILVLNLQEEVAGGSIRRNVINDIYLRAALNDPDRYLHYTDKQNVSSDIAGLPKAAAIIEGHETHTRTAEIAVDLSTVPGFDKEIFSALTDPIIRVPVTQAVIYGWYDNELGSYVNLLCDRTVSIANDL